MGNQHRAQSLARQLREARIAAGLSQMESAGRLKRPQSYVSRCEAGRRRIDVFELQEFARVYGKPLAFFVRGFEISHNNGSK